MDGRTVLGDQWRPRRQTTGKMLDFDALLIHRKSTMNRQNVFDEMQSKISQLLKNSPAADIERNIKELVAQALRKMDLVTREDFELQRELLARTREKLEALEQKVAELEKLKR
jgi:ubiquinone biosynthesis accessory factor UbiK